MANNTKKEKKKPLTTKQVRFCELVARGLGKNEAYIKAFEYKGAELNLASLSSRLSNRKDIQEKIEEEKKLVEKLKTNAGIEEQDQLRNKLVEINDGREESEDKVEWSQNIAFNKLKDLLTSCESATELLKERPKIFADIKIELENFKKLLANKDLNMATLEEFSADERFIKIFGDICKTLEHIEDMTYKLTKFNVKEFNSAISTANSVMKEMNNITGVTKNSQALKNENFEDRLYRLISESQKMNKATANSNDLLDEIEKYAWEE